jgi:hypothetical protein
MHGNRDAISSGCDSYMRPKVAYNKAFVWLSFVAMTLIVCPRFSIEFATAEKCRVGGGSKIIPAWIKGYRRPPEGHPRAMTVGTYPIYAPDPIRLPLGSTALGSTTAWAAT